MNNEFEKITSYLNKSLIESEIEYAKKENISLTIAKFKYKVDIDNAFLFKDIIKEISFSTQLAPIFYDKQYDFFILFKNIKLHKTVSTFKKIQLKLKINKNVKIDRVGITQLDPNDSTEDILNRVEKYLTTSKRQPEGRIVYGYRNYDFYDINTNEETIKTLFAKKPEAKIFNVYKGIPIKEDASVVFYDNNIICLKTSLSELLYLQKNEKFIYIKHKEIPNAIKADILKIDLKKSMVCVKNFEFQDDSILLRENIRIAPTKNIRATIKYQNRVLANGTISTISVESISIKLGEEFIKKLELFSDETLNLNFKLFTKSSIAVNEITTKAKLYKIVNDEAIFIITPNGYIKEKISSFIKESQKEIIKNLKQNILIR